MRCECFFSGGTDINQDTLVEDSSLRDIQRREIKKISKEKFNFYFSSVSEEDREEGCPGQTNIVENKSEDNITRTATRVRESFQAIFSLRSSELRSLSQDIKIMCL